MNFFQPSALIPTQAWRLGVFFLPGSVTAGSPEEQVKKTIAAAVTKGGMDISYASITPLDAWMSVYGEAAQGWGAYVRNTVHGLTTAQFIRSSSLPALFSMEVAEGVIDTYLDLLQGPYAAEVWAARPQIWTTPESMLRTGVWYSAVAVWLSGQVPSVQILEQRLKAGGYDLYSNAGAVRTFYYRGQPNGLMFLVFTGAKPTRVKEVTKAIQADYLTMNLAAPMDMPSITATDRLQEAGDETLSALTDLGVGIGQAISEGSEGAGTVVDVMGFVGKYFLPILVVGAGAYLFYRHRQKKKYEHEDYWPSEY